MSQFPRPKLLWLDSRKNTFFNLFLLKMDALKLIYISVVVTLLGIGAGIYLAYTNGYINFIERIDLLSLGMMIIASILIWAGMIFMVNGSFQKPDSRQWVAFVATVLIAILWWMRFLYSLSTRTSNSKS